MRTDPRGDLSKPAAPEAGPINGPLSFVAIEILGRLPKTTKGNRFVLFITGKRSKLTGAISLTKTTAVHVYVSFMDNCKMV